MKDIEKIKAARRARTAQEIADALKKSGMSHKEFASRMNRMPSEVTKWLSGDHNFTTNLLAEISVVLGTPISGAEDMLFTDSVSKVVDGYKKSSAEEELQDTSCCCLYDVEIPSDVAAVLQDRAESKGMTFRQFVKDILCSKAKEKTLRLVDFAGSIDENFPSAEELRAMRTTNTRTECDIF